LQPSTAARGQGRDRLVQSALILFGQHGIDNTTLRDVVAHAGVSLGLVRTHFGSKQGLQNAINQYVFEQLEEFYTAAEGDGITSLGDLTSGRWALTSQAPSILAYLRQVITKPEQCSELVESLFERIYIVLESASKDGEIHPQLDLRWCACTIMSLHLGPLMMEPYAQTVIGDSMYSESSLVARKQTYGQIFANGILANSTVSES
jgi:AcrR family transcriptional regulator